MTDPRLFATIVAASDKPESKDRPSHPTQRPFTSMGTRTARFGNFINVFFCFSSISLSFYFYPSPFIFSFFTSFFHCDFLSDII